MFMNNVVPDVLLHTTAHRGAHGTRKLRYFPLYCDDVFGKHPLVGSHRYERLQEVLMKGLERAVTLTNSIRGFEQELCKTR